jgi:glycosyltransferase family protein
MFVPTVIEEFLTIQTILDRKASIGRYGDGEFRSARGSNLKFQDAHPVLSTKLQDVLRTSDDRFLVGIPRVWGRRDLYFYDPIKHDNWLKTMQKEDFLGMLVPEKTYYSSFITRPDAAVHIECDDYYRLVQSIWRGRRVVYFAGRNGKPLKAMEGRGFLQEAEELKIEWCLEENAFSEYEQLIERARKYDPKKWLVLLSLGPTATVLAWDLFQLGYQALDIGHMPMFYNRQHPKLPKFFRAILDKYVALGMVKIEDRGGSDGHDK